MEDSSFTWTVAASLVTGGVILYSVIRATNRTTPASTKSVQKQGAYGKIKTHQQSLWTLLLEPNKLVKLYTFYKIKNKLAHRGRFSEQLDMENTISHHLQTDLDFSELMLAKVSRSFALVIKFLPNTSPEHLRLAVGVFYLVLRALDTVEDEMNLNKFAILEANRRGVSREKVSEEEAAELKRQLLVDFCNRLEGKEDGTAGVVLQDIGEGDELKLLMKFDSVVRLYALLPKNIRDIVYEITKEMGLGMAQYIARNLKNGTVDEKDFFLYCHYVAGLVGDGLTKLFTATGALELAPTGKECELFESMGQFLQRTNIIRDYLEDFVDGRAFWPQEVWKRHLTPLCSTQDSLGVFAETKVIESGASVNCLNEMILNTLPLVSDSLLYLSKITEERVFAFCAVPQVMAIRTLEECFNNKNVFTGVVKISKADSATILLDLLPAELKTGSANEDPRPLQQRDLYKNCMNMFKESVSRIKQEALQIGENEIASKVVQVCSEIIDVVP